MKKGMKHRTVQDDIAPERGRVAVGVLAAVAGVCLGVGAGVVPAAAVAPTPGVGSSVAGAAVPAGLESFYGQTVEWYDCGATGGMERSAEATAFKCAKVKVPLDYSQPDGETIEIAMKKHVAPGSIHRGSLFINPGGPGGSGVQYVEAAAETIFAGVQGSYDIVGFDPRGVGASTPITCTATPEAPAVAEAAPAAPAGAGSTFEQRAPQIAAKIKQTEADCAANTKPAGLLDHVDTVSVARDLDVLRALSGDEKLNYLGFSYGTYLGAHYAELFPANTGRMVFDGAMDPSLSLGERASAQAKGFENSLRVYVEKCQAGQLGPGCPLTGGTDAGVQQIRDLITAADQEPLRTSDPNATVDGSMIRVVVRRLMYSSEYWSALTYALDQAVSQQEGTYFQMLHGPATAGVSVPTFYAVNCLDIPAQGDMAAWEKEYQQNIQESPTFGASLSNQDVRCRAWGHNGTRRPATIHAQGAAPILVVGVTGDPAAPYAWSEALADQLESGRLLTWEGNGHTAYGRADACIHSAVDEYLIGGTMPEPGLVCKDGE